MSAAPLTLAALTAWSYAGFVADPPSPPAGTAVVPPSPSPSAPAVAVADIVRPGPDSTGRGIVAAEPAPATPAVAPARYQMADLGGQVWEHDDPATLQAFVIDRNAQLSLPAQPPARLRLRPRR